MSYPLKRITRVSRSNWMRSGVGFLAAGLLLAILLLTMLPWPIDIGTFSILAGVPMFLGTVLMCVRNAVILDRQRRTFSTWWGLLVPFCKSEHPLPQFNYVTVSFGTRAETDTYSSVRFRVYPVRLEGPGANAITLHEPDNHDTASLLAEDVAKFLRLGILDRSLGWDVVREAATLK